MGNIIGTIVDWVHLVLVVIVLGVAALLNCALQCLLFCFTTVFPCFPRLRLQRVMSDEYQRMARNVESSAGRPSAKELAEAANFCLEEHHAVTADGCVLVLHRLLDPQLENESRGIHNGDRPAVLLMHGLMQDSESLLCGGREHALGLRLAAAGFDVFLGNARGNRYSHKHLRLSPQSSNEYWNFSIDELAQLDVPTMVDEALKVSGQSKLCYIGFSQGTAMAFAGLSSNTDLLGKVFLFVALSPAARANHLSKSFLTSVVQQNLRFIYLLFGRRRMLSIAIWWQRTVSRTFFVKTIDVSMGYLFSWKSSQMSLKRKLEVYPHIYSGASVKCVVHWFQMMQSGRLSLFGDCPAGHYVPVTYDLAKVSCPVAIVHGGSDHLGGKIRAPGHNLGRHRQGFCVSQGGGARVEAIPAEQLRVKSTESVVHRRHPSVQRTRLHDKYEEGEMQALAYGAGVKCGASTSGCTTNLVFTKEKEKNSMYIR